MRICIELMAKMSLHCLPPTLALRADTSIVIITVYHNGDMVLVEKSKDIGYGEVGAFLIGNEAFIKESQKDGLHSYNKIYKTMKFTEDDSVQIIGRVIGVIDASDFASDRDTEIFMLHEQGNI